MTDHMHHIRAARPAQRRAWAITGDRNAEPTLSFITADVWRNRRLIEFAQDHPGTLGRAMKRKRLAQRLTLTHLAEMAGSSRQNLWQVETAYRSNYTAINALPALIAVLGITIDDLRAEITATDEQERAA